MPLENRVTPFGDLVASPARGLFLGNRGGRIHDPATRRLTGRRWASHHWITCVLAFKNRHRRVWGRGYTELFFCDEVTALAAGHRPCMECRRTNAVVFRAAVAGGLGLGAPPSCDGLDRLLHAERLDGRVKRLHCREADTLPDGAVIVGEDGAALALLAARALPWTPAGYATPRPRPSGPVMVLTPPATLAALAAGYRPHWHPSAARDG
ncbi:hypothetical protein QNA08_06725 [Chelatococcus sp. SYSU_G07232]|uniref:Uncharacterized protein n=1 Tax=Chelatococcus albus TaxID=3047466 RepID=A0ABT7AEY5_9HYPH|nr:hypothetical protein [Chelatococcus sp. SYSU_G07232]MDJ1157926.1 hypothetical protein [Chelatococcus sp. SYSU_G07232]